MPETNAVTKCLVEHFGYYSGHYDAFQRHRVSEPFTTFDSKQIFDNPDLGTDVENQPLFFDNQEVSGAGTSTVYSVNTASTSLFVSANTAGRRVRQTRQKINYQPGKSQLGLFTFNFRGASAEGITKREGLYDDKNGLFIQHKDGVLSFVKRSYVTGEAVDLVIPQEDWNIDRLDGHGESGIVFDASTAHIYIVDFAWLGVGSVRFGVFVGGKPVYCHVLDNANVNATVYMSNPNLPIRTEIINDGTGPVSRIDQICSSITSEGGVQPNGVTRSCNNGAVAISANSAGTNYMGLAIRLRTGYENATINLEGITLVITTNNTCLWQLIFSPTYSSAPTFNAFTDAAVEFAAAAGSPASITVSGGYVLASGYSTQDSGVINIPLGNAIRLGGLIDGTQDTLVLAVRPLSNNETIYTSLSWREV